MLRTSALAKRSRRRKETKRAQRHSLNLLFINSQLIKSHCNVQLHLIRKRERYVDEKSRGQASIGRMCVRADVAKIEMTFRAAVIVFRPLCSIYRILARISLDVGNGNGNERTSAGWLNVRCLPEAEALPARASAVVCGWGLGITLIESHFRSFRRANGNAIHTGVKRPEI
ncbi:hypothetical protein DMN91_000426 [Ooceraea biroi]|uniref:Uncharacterized protein n=1 Tax=Ooceraea biroi TaxID=2015173 RepID=A0A3L8E1M7_OOCBI|nr:hypothetical protein DMN91_000426 [Ooceraea biroi]